jgi:hypothetical protein
MAAPNLPHSTRAAIFERFASHFPVFAVLRDGRVRECRAVSAVNAECR